MEELNTKWWYRLIKVVYIFSFLFSLTIAVLIVVNNYYPKLDTFLTSYQLQCVDGRTMGEFYSSDLNYDNSDFATKNYDVRVSLAKIDCSGSYSSTTDDMVDIYENHKDMIPNDVNYRIIPRVPAYTSTWGKFGLSIILAIAIPSILFALIRTLFFYVLIGREFWKTLILRK